MSMPTILAVLSGLFWSIVYVESIRVGIKQKTYAMPFWALALNLAWEAQYAGLRFMTGHPVLQDYINAIWFLLDLGLLYTYLKYGKRHFPKKQQKYFGGWVFAGLASAVILQRLFLQTYGFNNAAVYSAFLQNLLMSILFINMWSLREGQEGQNLLIAVSKWLGTLAATLSFGFYSLVPGTEHFTLTTGALIALFDMAYIALLWKNPPASA